MHIFHHEIGHPPSHPSCAPPVIHPMPPIIPSFRGRYLVGRIHSVMDRVGARVERCGVGPLVGALPGGQVTRCASASPLFSPSSTERLSKSFHEKPTPDFLPPFAPFGGALKNLQDRKSVV